MERISRKTTIITLLIVCGIIFGYLAYVKNSAPKTTVTTNYILETAKISPITVSVSSTGNVFAAVTKDIVPNNSGELKSLTLKEGDTVKKGQTLFLVDSAQIRQQVSSSELNLEKQKLQLDKMKTEADIDLQNLQIKDAQNSYDNAMQQYNNMTVYSPINGVVTVKNNNNGDTVQSGKAVLSLIDPTALKVKASVDELDISKVKVGQGARVTFNAIVGKTYDGTVDTISQVGTTTNNVTTYTVVINLTDTTDVLLGMTANVIIMVESKSDALVIPAEALIERGNRKLVMVPNPTSTSSPSQILGRLNGATSSPSVSGRGNYQGGAQITAAPGKLIEVETGIQNENLVEITDGISAGQKVLTILPQATSGSTSTKTGNRSLTGGFGGGVPGMGGGGRTAD